MQTSARTAAVSQTGVPTDGFAVDFATSLQVRIAWGLRRQWIRAGWRESRTLRRELEAIPVDRPVFISGLARSGSTVLLEYLAAHTDVATHRYRDFPFVFIPVGWSRFLDRLGASSSRPAPTERAHRDGVFVTRESPEAIEETLWLSFFERPHDPDGAGALSSGMHTGEFEQFYREHIKKILFLRGGTRFVSKNNYHVTRLAYLLRMFPDCRFVLPVRRPLTHVASLIKQHRLFCAGQTAHPRSREYLRVLGHFEFGLDRNAIELGDSSIVSSIRELWASGDEVRGWARYWSAVYGYLWDLLQTVPAVAAACTIVRYEDLCERPDSTLSAVSGHAGLTIERAKGDEFARRIHYPAYYTPTFSSEETRCIHEETAVVALRFGYSPDQYDSGGDWASPKPQLGR